MELPEPIPEDEEILAEVITHESQMILPRNTESDPISTEHTKLLEIIAEMNIPDAQMESPAWKSFFNVLNLTFVIPHTRMLHGVILEYAEKNQRDELKELRGKSPASSLMRHK